MPRSTRALRQFVFGASMLAVRNRFQGRFGGYYAFDAVPAPFNPLHGFRPLNTALGEPLNILAFGSLARAAAAHAFIKIESGQVMRDASASDA
jgi:hypothetical protein